MVVEFMLVEHGFNLTSLSQSASVNVYANNRKWENIR